MLLHNAPQDQAVMSNVGQIGEFTIRNSAKAFGILSSGLYANKIKAIIRELSCNAIDSHKVAGKEDTKFSVHLPTVLEPHFSIRDYGVGLSHEQVTNLYTTYFESTKTMSNDFIGALGLGSKSPFSYTDNFTVIAIKDGRKGIYTAFINQEGVPSIALMSEEQTDELPGVEIKFSVNSHQDFRKFQEEASSVYKWFKNKPEVTSPSDFKIEEITYDVENIIPGIHSRAGQKYGSRGPSYALMGNIAYPIDVPKADTTIDENLRKLLNCSLVIEFGIGDLDFQASREGLSYIPLTVESIKKKLQELNNQLFKHVQKEADAITNLWARTEYLFETKSKDLWCAAVVEYVNSNKHDIIEMNSWGMSRKKFIFKVQELASTYNIIIRGFSKRRDYTTCTTYKEERVYDSNDRTKSELAVSFQIDLDTNFVVNNTKVGATERAKNHWRENSTSKKYEQKVFVLEPFDKTRPMKTADFFKSIYNPPNIFNASDLLLKERAKTGIVKNVSILKLVEKQRSRWSETTMVWNSAGDIKSFDSNKTYYYLPLSGFESLLNYNTKELFQDIKRAFGKVEELYGVRKNDIDEIRKQKNWVPVEDMIRQKLNALTEKDFRELIISMLDRSEVFYYNKGVNAINKDSPYRKFAEKFAGAVDKHKSFHTVNKMLVHFNDDKSLTAKLDAAKVELESIKNRYPLLDRITSRTESTDVSVLEYVNLIDNVKGV